MIQIGRSEKDKRRAQHAKLLKDFPWLWAIRPKWTLGWPDIRVVSTNDMQSGEFDIRHILHLETGNQLEMWIVILSCFSTEVIRIQVPEDNDCCWAELIRESFPSGSSVVHIVTVEKPVTERESFFIYRVPKGIYSFNQMIYDLANAYPAIRESRCNQKSIEK